MHLHLRGIPLGNRPPVRPSVRRFDQALTATDESGVIHVVGGLSSTGTIRDSYHRFQSPAPGWESVPLTGSPPEARYRGSATWLFNCGGLGTNCMYVTGGQSSTALYYQTSRR